MKVEKNTVVNEEEKKTVVQILKTDYDEYSDTKESIRIDLQRRNVWMDMDKEMILWLVLLIVFLVVEAATVGLVSIWLAGGALAALLLSLTGVDLIWQIVLFLVTSFALLLFTRPLARKYLNPQREKTNYEGLIGEIVKVTETVDNYAQTGTAVAKGLDWTARSSDNEKKIEAGMLAKVLKVSGVKLILEEYKEEA